MRNGDDRLYDRERTRQYREKHRERLNAARRAKYQATKTITPQMHQRLEITRLRDALQMAAILIDDPEDWARIQALIDGANE